MEKIKNIPIVGFLLRMILGIIKLPKHLDVLYLQNEEISKRECVLQLQQDVLKQEQEALKRQQDELRQQQVEMLSIQTHLQQVHESIVRQYDSLQMATEELRRWNADRMDNIRSVQDRLVVLENLHVGEEYIEKLNLICSLQPTVWGKKDRLHISKLASVSACFFNTNSGHITIGDYTYSGSGVSILTGSHDVKLTGLVRRDAEKVEGCDIEIGKGVWLASNCTILGPATIGDNAVIAAGAVVTPGSIIPPNTIYGGVPARKIGNIDACEGASNYDFAILKALERNRGVLFVEGWTEKKTFLDNDIEYIGHYQVTKEAKIYITNDRFCGYYRTDNPIKTVIYIKIDDQSEMQYCLDELSGKIEININNSLDECEMMWHTISIRLEDPEVCLFVAQDALEEE